MPVYRLSKLARLDLLEIADYTVDIWGEAQAQRYLDELANCLDALLKNPLIGRPCDHIREGYRRIEFKKHVTFYRIEGGDLFISRILHQSMLPHRQRFQEQ